MKKLFFFLVLISFVYADLSVEQIRNMVMKIHQKRAGIELEKLETTKEPFVRIEEDSDIIEPVLLEKSEETKLALHAILNNRAYINDGWKSINDNVGGYILKHIGTKGVVLRNGNQIKKLFLNQEREKLIITVEGREIKW